MWPSYGSFTLGRQYTPYYSALSQVGDPFGAGYAGSARNLFPTVGANTRTSNTVLYVSPNVRGVTGELAYSLGEQAGSSEAGRQIGAALSYSAGRLHARLAHNHRNNDITAAAGRGIGRNTLLAANYDFGPARGYLAYSVDKGLNSSYGKIKNRRGAGYTVGNNTDSGSGDSAYNLGVRHAF